jgi:hypothetical protein
MVSCSVSVVTKQRYFDGETRVWGGFSLVTFRNFAVWRKVGFPGEANEGCWGVFGLADCQVKALGIKGNRI